MAIVQFGQKKNFYKCRKIYETNKRKKEKRHNKNEEWERENAAAQILSQFKIGPPDWVLH